jgi:hypothetical protein
VVVVNRNTELARAREVIDFLSELPFRETEKGEMGERVERGSSCPLLVKGKSFELWKQEVKAWQIVVETTEEKKKSWQWIWPSTCRTIIPLRSKKECSMMWNTA